MSNRAAIFNGNQAVPFYDIENIPIPKVPKDAILIKAVAYAVNPVDSAHIAMGLGIKGTVVGSDVSGIIEDVGSEVKGFAKGDYVSTWLHGLYKPKSGAFQDYVISNPVMTVKYDKSVFKTEPLPVGNTPSSLVNTFEGAASTSLSLSTAVYALAHGLKLHSEDPSNKENYILLWGGATAVGVIAIQIAKVVYGLKVITTASPQHHDFLKSLGAAYVIDYKDKDAVDQIKKIGGGKIYSALDAVSKPDTFQSVYDATSEAVGGTVRIANLLFLEDSILKKSASRENVKFTKVSAFTVDGKVTTLGGFDQVPEEGLVENYNNFWYNILPGFVPKLKNTNLKVLKAGLESANEGLTLVGQGKVSGEKVVFRAN